MSEPDRAALRRYEQEWKRSSKITSLVQACGDPLLQDQFDHDPPRYGAIADTAGHLRHHARDLYTEAQKVDEEAHTCGVTYTYSDDDAGVCARPPRHDGRHSEADAGSIPPRLRNELKEVERLTAGLNDHLDTLASAFRTAIAQGDELDANDHQELLELASNIDSLGDDTKAIATALRSTPIGRQHTQLPKTGPDITDHLNQLQRNYGTDPPGVT